MNSAPRASSRPSWSTTLAIAGAVVVTAVVAWWQRKKQREAAASPTPPTQPAAAASAHPHEAQPSEGKEPQDSSGSGDAAVVAAQPPPSGRALPASQLALVAKVCRFWFGDADPQQQQFQLRNALWFRGGAEVDAHIATEFKAAMNMAAKGKLAAWATAPRAVDVSGSADGPTLSHTHSPLVALVLLLDQFPRNAFRGTAKSFDADAKAVEVVQVRGWGEVVACAARITRWASTACVWSQAALADGLDAGLGLCERIFLYVTGCVCLSGCVWLCVAVCGCVCVAVAVCVWLWRWLWLCDCVAV